jgi:hypothetical protein
MFGIKRATMPPKVFARFHRWQELTNGSRCSAYNFNKAREPALLVGFGDRPRKTRVNLYLIGCDKDEDWRAAMIPKAPVNLEDPGGIYTGNLLEIDQGRIL